MPALQDLTAILGVLAQNVRPNIVRTYNRRSQFLRMARVEQGEGKNVAWDWESDAAVAETFNDGDDVVNFGSDALAQAILTWGLYRSNFKVGDLARAAAKSSRTPTGLLRIWARNLMNAISKNASTINKDLFNGVAANGVTGLATAISDSNTYATVDRTQGANAGFRAKVIDPGQPTKTTIASVRDDLRQVFEIAGEQPTAAWTTPTIYNSLGGQFDDSRRRVQEIEGPNGPVKLDGSVGGIEIDGCVFFRDKDATVGSIYYLNDDAYHVEYLEQDMDVPGDPAIDDSYTEQAEDTFGTLPLGMTAEALAKTGAAAKAHVKVFCQLVVEAPHMCAVRKNAA